MKKIGEFVARLIKCLPGIEEIEEGDIKNLGWWGLIFTFMVVLNILSIMFELIYGLALVSMEISLFLLSIPSVAILYRIGRIYSYQEDAPKGKVLRKSKDEKIKEELADICNDPDLKKGLRNWAKRKNITQDIRKKLEKDKKNQKKLFFLMLGYVKRGYIDKSLLDEFRKKNHKLTNQEIKKACSKEDLTKYDPKKIAKLKNGIILLDMGCSVLEEELEEKST